MPKKKKSKKIIKKVRVPERIRLELERIERFKDTMSKDKYNSLKKVLESKIG